MTNQKMVCNMTKSVLGRFWFREGQQRPYYSITEMPDLEGDKVEVEYLATSPELGVHLKKLIISRKNLITPKGG